MFGLLKASGYGFDSCAIYFATRCSFMRYQAYNGLPGKTWSTRLRGAGERLRLFPDISCSAFENKEYLDIMSD